MEATLISMIVFVTRASGLTREEFSDYWINKHAPLVKSVPEFMKYVRRYVQHHCAPVPPDEHSLFGDLPDYDGVGEIWFDSRAAMQAAFQEPRYLEVIRPDEVKFFDAARCLSFVGVGNVMFDSV